MPFVQREIALNNGPPWGFRLYEDSSKGLIVHRIRQYSPAQDAKLREGDVLLSINSVSTRGMGHAAAVDQVDFTYNMLVLLVGRYESVHNKSVTFMEHRGQIQAGKVTHLEISNLQREPMTTPASPGLVPLPISRLLAEHDIPPRPEAVVKKKRFANSEFFEDGSVHYPTLEERMDMAKKMADSLTAPINRASKGAHIFERQRQRIEKYVKEGPDPEPELDESLLPSADELLMHPPPPPPFPPLGFPGLPSTASDWRHQPPPPPPPPPPGAPRTLLEFLERVKRAPRVEHNSIGPELCFRLASALHNGQDRGSRIFLRNRQRSVKWEVTGEDRRRSSVTTTTTTTTVQQVKMVKPPSKLPTKMMPPPPSPQAAPGATSYPKDSINCGMMVDRPNKVDKWRPVKFKVPARV